MKMIHLNSLILSIFFFPSVFILNSCDDKNNQIHKPKEDLSQPQMGDSGSRGSGSTRPKEGK